MYRPHQHSDKSLAYTLSDCLAAIQANPGGNKVPEYHTTAQACQRELSRRERLRHWRETVQRHDPDPLVFRVKDRRHVRRRSIHKFYLDQGMHAMVALAVERLAA